MKTAVNVNVPDADIEELTGPEIKAHIAAITGQPERKIATRTDGLKTLRRLRQWSRNADGLLGVPKDSAPVVRTLAELRAKAAGKGKTFDETLPKSHERVTPIDPEWDEAEDIVDGNEAVVDHKTAVFFAATAPGVNVDKAFASDAPAPSTKIDPAPAPHGVIESPAQPEATEPVEGDDDEDTDAEDAPVPTIPAGPAATMTARGVEVQVGEETIVHPRGSMRARLAVQAAEAKPIQLAASATKDRRPKKETGEPRKQREALLGVRATFAGTTKNHKGSLRYNVLVFIQSKGNREIPGWVKGTVLPAEIDAHFDTNCKPFLHKLIEDGHLARCVPLLPGQSATTTEAKETVAA